ncbi:hypothetical protein MUP01_03580 [Candidatus Bathyarchaeota archaeon]|nr:hypothetical protein [Candidatus Bathyarchaeota archaeon]
MEYRYMGREKHLESFAAKTEQFLLDNDFGIAKETSENRIKLVGIRRMEGHETRRIEITLSRMKRDLSIKFECDESLGLLKSTSFFTFLGGGPILRKKLLESEFYREIERKYWNEMEALADQSKSP